MPVILGGGITGLSAGYYLTKYATKKSPIKIFEASNRYGGWIKTEISAYDKSIRFESGPRTIRPKGVKGINTLQLISDLSMHKDVLPITWKHPAARNRMICVDDKLHLLPTSIFAMLKVTPPFSKPIISALFHDFTNKTTHSLNDDSIYNFTARRFGDEMAKYIVSSMICGICAGDAKKISVKFLMKELFEYEKKYGNVCSGLMAKLLTNFGKMKAVESAESAPSALVERSIKEKWSIYSLKNGIEMLPQKLVDYLAQNAVELNKNSKCDRIDFDGETAFVSVNGQEHKTNSLICSLPTFEIGRLLKKQHPLLANDLLSINYVDVAVVNLQYSSTNILPTPAFGFLIPPSEGSPILGVIYDSCCFHMNENTVLTVMISGKWINERLHQNNIEEMLLKLAIEFIRRIFKTIKLPEDYRVNILRKCIPQYEIGHYDKIDRICQYIEEHKLPIRLCGSAYDGVGVNDVIYSAKQAVKSMKI